MPIFKHDCETCTYICTVVEQGEWGECYIHKSTSPQQYWTAIIRTGNEGPNYMSRQVGDLNNMTTEHGFFNSWMALRESAIQKGVIIGPSMIVPNKYDKFSCQADEDAYNAEEEAYEASLKVDQST